MRFSRPDRRISSEAVKGDAEPARELTDHESRFGAHHNRRETQYQAPGQDKLVLAKLVAPPLSGDQMQRTVSAASARPSGNSHSASR